MEQVNGTCAQHGYIGYVGTTRGGIAGRKGDYEMAQEYEMLVLPYGVNGNIKGSVRPMTF